LSTESPLDEIHVAMDTLSVKTAPIARSWWTLLLLVQGLAVAAPLTWFFYHTLNWLPRIPALATLASVLLFVGALWWWRWKGRQRLWTRARLLAEVTRGQMAAAVCPQPVDLPFLAMIPALRPFLGPVGSQPEAKQPWPLWRDTWLKSRLDDQLEFYRKALKKAAAQRQRLGKWITLLMDLMLALAVAAAVVTLSHRAPEWLRLLGDTRLESAVGFTAAMLPLGIILLQALRSLQELNRRTSRFSRQLAMLQRERQRLLVATDSDEAMRVVQSVESQLLSEVADWYFEAETAEQYFKLREDSADPAEMPAMSAPSVPRQLAAMLVLGGGLAFLGRVVLGRAPWVVGSCAFTLCWLTFKAPTDPAALSKLKIEGTLLDDHQQPWQPRADRAQYGCIIIAHGLHDGVSLVEPDGGVNWTIRLDKAIQERLGRFAPNICLVDWSTAAHPADLYQLDPRISAGTFAADVTGIRSEAYQVGEALAFRLSQQILDGKVDTTKPLLFIGHSAGGFVVGRAVRLLRKLNLIPATTKVTILDTPVPDDEMLKELPKVCAVDYYVTSGFVRGLDEQAPPAGIHLKHIPTAAGLSLLQAHSFAYRWFLGTVDHRGSHEGFERSAFVSAAPDP
jgi:hypothetical protein